MVERLPGIAGAKTNLGNAETLLGARPADIKTLLEVNVPPMSEEQQWYTAGSWLLSCEAYDVVITDGGQVPAMVVFVTFGSGGAKQSLKLNPFPDFTIALPGGKVTVDVGWDPDLPVGYGLPASAKVRATLQRSSQTPKGGRLVRWLPMSNLGVVIRPLPQFVKAVSLRADFTHPIWDSDTLITFAPQSQRHTGIDFRERAQRGQELAVPAQANNVSVVWPAATQHTNAAPSGLDFLVNL